MFSSRFMESLIFFDVAYRKKKNSCKDVRKLYTVQNKREKNALSFLGKLGVWQGRTNLSTAISGCGNYCYSSLITMLHCHILGIANARPWIPKVNSTHGMGKACPEILTVNRTAVTELLSQSSLFLFVCFSV